MLGAFGTYITLQVALYLAMTTAAVSGRRVRRRRAAALLRFRDPASADHRGERAILARVAAGDDRKRRRIRRPRALPGKAAESNWMHNPKMPLREAPESSAPIPTAFVLAGGGSLGAVQVGMLQALLTWGEVPSLLVGTSAGAINAAYIASRPTSECADGLGHIWCAVRRRMCFPSTCAASWRRCSAVAIIWWIRADCATSWNATSLIGCWNRPRFRSIWSRRKSSRARRSCCRRGLRSKRCWPARPFRASSHRSSSVRRC